MSKISPSVLDPQVDVARLQAVVSEMLAEARGHGADACEVGVNLDVGLSTRVRMGAVETIEFNRDQGFGITVYVGQKKGSASTSDSSPEAIRDAVQAAYDIACYASEDPCAGLAEAALMAQQQPDLDLYHPWVVNTEQAIDLAITCEQAGRALSPKITQSDEVNVTTHQSCRLYGNSHGFMGSEVSSCHSLSAVLIAQQGDEMQRDYWYTTARAAADLESAASVGQRAAARTIARLGGRKIATGRMPIVFAPEVAGSLLAHFLSAISGSNLYRQSSFLLDYLGKPVFPDWVRIHEQPLLKKAPGSASFDNDGLATQAKDFITAGVLTHYLLSTYSARKLGMVSTANAGGAHNLFIDSNARGGEALLKQMGTGLLVTELMGQGVNLVTGDYSRGATGFWVENGTLQHPVTEVTIAGNLRTMFMNLVAAGDDIDRRSNIQTGSLLIDDMTVAGN